MRVGLEGVRRGVEGRRDKDGEGRVKDYLGTCGGVRRVCRGECKGLMGVEGRVYYYYGVGNDVLRWLR